MSSLRQHFQNLKATVDWCWTLAILCMIGYFTLGQLVQIYWAMVVFGSIAGSFGLFYEFSCQKLAELDDIEDIYKLQKLVATADAAQKLIRDFSTRNSEIVLQLPDFTQATQPVSNSRTKAAQKLQQQVNFQKQAARQQSSPPSSQQSSPPSSRQPSSSQSSSEFLPSQSPQPRSTTNRAQSSAIPRNKTQGVSGVPLQNFGKSRLTDEEYKLTLNKADYEWVRPHSKRNGTPVKGYWRRKRNRK